MILPLLLAAAAPQATALDAERAFASDAKTLGQWTAFKKWAADDATMFVPQPIKAQAWLKDQKDPAKAIEWWPTASYVSCDGKLAVNTGGWKQPGGSAGYFSTVWQRQPGGYWKWIVDGGDDLKIARDRPREPEIKPAACRGKATKPPEWTFEHGQSVAKTGTSPDGTLAWQWISFSNGARNFHAYEWTGTQWNEVVSDKVSAAK